MGFHGLPPRGSLCRYLFRPSVCDGLCHRFVTVSTPSHVTPSFLPTSHRPFYSSLLTLFTALLLSLHRSSLFHLLVVPFIFLRFSFGVSKGPCAVSLLFSYIHRSNGSVRRGYPDLSPLDRVTTSITLCFSSRFLPRISYVFSFQLVLDNHVKLSGFLY